MVSSGVVNFSRCMNCVPRYLFLGFRNGHEIHQIKPFANINEFTVPVIQIYLPNTIHLHWMNACLPGVT